MLGRIRQRKDNRALIDSRHGLDDLLRESATNRAHADDRGRLDALNSSDEIPCWRVLVCIRLLKVEQVRAVCLKQTVDVEHIDAGLRFLKTHALRNERGTEQIGKSNSGRNGAEEQELFVFQCNKCYSQWCALAAGKLLGADSQSRHLVAELKTTPSQVALAWLAAIIDALPRTALWP